MSAKWRTPPFLDSAASLRRLVGVLDTYGDSAGEAANGGPPHPGGWSLQDLAKGPRQPPRSRSVTLGRASPVRPRGAPLDGKSGKHRVLASTAPSDGRAQAHDGYS